MSKIISMPSNNAYRENWDRIFGTDASDHSESEIQEKKPGKTPCGNRCGCGKKTKKDNA